MIPQNLPDDPASRAIRSKALRDDNPHELRQTIAGQAKVIQGLRRELAEAVAAERERAARVCERLAMSWQNLSAAQSMLNEAAAEIRKG